jgi:hypothetical protein
VVGRVVEEDTPGGPRVELVRHSGCSVRVTRATKDAEMFVRGC